MKKVLSLIIALSLVIGLVPAAFAIDAPADEKLSITYDFSSKGVLNFEQIRFETITPEYTPAVDQENLVDSYDVTYTAADGSFVIDSKASYPEKELTTENAGEFWAYLGSNGKQSTNPISAPKTNGDEDPTQVYSGFNKPNSVFSGKFVGVVGTGNAAIFCYDAEVSGLTYVALKVKVPKTGYYKFASGSAYAYGGSSTDLRVYAAELTDDLAAELAPGNEETYGKAYLDDYTKSNQIKVKLTKSDTKYTAARSDGTSLYPYGYRENPKTFAQVAEKAGINVSNGALVDSFNTNNKSPAFYAGKMKDVDGKVVGVAEGDAATAAEYFFDFENARAMEFEANKEYVVFIAGNGHLTPASLTLKETEPDPLTFTFGTRSDVPTITSFEIMTATNNGDDTYSYSHEIKAEYADFPEDSDLPNDQYAYLGASTDTGAGIIESSKVAEGQSSVFIGTTLHPTLTDGVQKCALNTQYMPYDSWIAFKIKVPETGVYEFAGAEAYVYGGASTDVRFYLTEYDDEAQAIFARTNNETYGDRVGSWVTSGSYHFPKRELGISFTDLAAKLDIDPENGYVGKANISGSAKKVVPIDAEELEGNYAKLDAEKEYVLLLRQTQKTGSATIMLSSVSFVVADEAEVKEEISNEIEKEFDIAAPEAVVETAPSVDVFAVVKGGDTLSDVASAADNGDGTYKLTAAEQDGKTFLYWARGLNSSSVGRILSYEAEFNYTPKYGEGNYVIAVYEDEEAEASAKAEFYNGNGQLVNTLTGESIPVPAYPTMSGYGTATSWKCYENGESYAAGDTVELTEAMTFVAQYENGADGIEVNGVAMSYGDLWSKTAPTKAGKSFKWWTKTNINGETKVVSLDKTYSFYAWEDCTVTPIYEDVAVNYTGNAMKIVIDTFGTNSLMAEFVGFENVIEKGFVLNGTVEIAMNGTGNQFTVTNNDGATSVAGYVIYNDGGTVKKVVDGNITID